MNTGEIYDIFCNEILPKGSYGYSREEISDVVERSVQSRAFSNIAQPEASAYLALKELIKLKAARVRGVELKRDTETFIAQMYE